ncbi:MAG TPA: FAD:protein FMN transferase [Hyphomicrobiales bacterium]
MAQKMTRRRFIGITAAAAGLGPLLFGGAVRTNAAVVSWNGVALGAPATLQIHHHDRAAAEWLVQQAVAEVRRLEQLFSLYREDSALVALNRRGVLEAPAGAFVDLLEEARRFAVLTGGAFDPTVQPLWTLYAEHFARPGAAPEGPAPEAAEAALAKVGFGGVRVSRDRIVFLRSNMALTLNGIAQGFITDRVVDILRAGGIAHSLVDIGEARAMDSRPDGRPWEVGLSDPDDPEHISAAISLLDQAVATSGAYGFRFDGQGRFNHLFDPSTGRSASLYRRVTVIMPTATAADALSTGFSFLPIAEIEATLKRLGQGQVHIVAAEGQSMTLSA